MNSSKYVNHIFPYFNILKIFFRLRKEEPHRLLTVKIGTIDEQKRNGFREWFEVGSG